MKAVPDTEGENPIGQPLLAAYTEYVDDVVQKTNLFYFVAVVDDNWKQKAANIVALYERSN